MELWDAYNSNEEKLGIDLVRGEKIPNGLFHAVVMVIVKHQDGTYLLMQRHLEKSIFPGRWEAGASGSVLKGETFEEGARRELVEETGINSDNIIFIGTSIDNKDQAFYKNYLCICNIDKDSIKLQDRETIGFKWVSKDRLLTLIGTENFAAPSAEWLREYICLM